MATGKKAGFGMIAITIFALMGSLCSCEDKNEKELRARERTREVEKQFKNDMDKLSARVACESQGGIVITDKDGNMINCVFKPGR